MSPLPDVTPALLAALAPTGELRVAINLGNPVTIRQPAGVSHDRGEPAAEYVAAYVEEQKASGFVADALARHGVDGAAVAPAEPTR